MRATKLLVLLSLLVPSIAFGAMTVTDRGTSSNSGSQASTAFAPTATIAAGSAGFLYIAADNANGSSANFPAGPLTDSAGNSWYRLFDNAGGATANATLETVAYYCPSLTTQLTSGGSITTTYTTANVTSKVGSFIEIAPGTAGNWIIAGKEASNTASAATTVSVSTVPQLFIGQLVIGGCGVEHGTDGFTGDADTQNGSWSTMQHAVVGAGNATGMGVITQWKVQTTATSGQVFNPTFSSNDAHAEIILFQEADSKARGFDGSSTSQASTTTILQSLSVPMSTGSTCVLAMALDNTGLNGATTNVNATDITDSQGNIWTLRQDQFFDNGAAGAGAEVAVWTSTLTHGLVRTDTMTVTYGGVNVADKTWAFYEFSNATAYANSGNGGSGTSATPSITTGSSITTPNIVVGVLSSEGDTSVTIDSDTSNGNWSAGTVSTAGGGGASSMTLAMQYKAVTGTATQTYNPTLTSQDNIMAWVELTVPATATTLTKIPSAPNIPSIN